MEEEYVQIVTTTELKENAEKIASHWWTDGWQDALKLDDQ